MESASSGSEQLMFRTGQLREESNWFWSLDFKNYHGLKSVSDLPYVSIDTVSRKRFNSKQIEHYLKLMKYLKVLVKDTVCFQLISMAMLLDTSALMEKYGLSEDTCENELIHVTQSSTDQSYHLHEINLYRNMEQRFEEIRALQKHYIKLFHNRCMYLDNSELINLNDTDQHLKRTMIIIKEISYYISLLVK